MRLDQYIRQVGENEAARVLEASVRAIRSWRYGARRPRPEKASEIQKRTGGLVTLEEIYAPREG